MLIPERRRRRIAIVLGVVLYVCLLTVMVLGAQGEGRHLGFGSFRYRATWSDTGILLTLIVAGPAVIWAAIVNWRRK